MYACAELFSSSRQNGIADNVQNRLSNWRLYSQFRQPTFCPGLRNVGVALQFTYDNTSHMMLPAARRARCRNAGKSCTAMVHGQLNFFTDAGFAHHICGQLIGRLSNDMLRAIEILDWRMLIFWSFHSAGESRRRAGRSSRSN